ATPTGSPGAGPSGQGPGWRRRAAAAMASSASSGTGVFSRKVTGKKYHQPSFDTRPSRKAGRGSECLKKRQKPKTKASGSTPLARTKRATGRSITPAGSTRDHSNAASAPGSGDSRDRKP